MRAMGLDFGDKTIGVAVSDELGWTAQGVEVIRRSTLKGDLERLAQLANTYGITDVVVGLPKNMNSTIGERGEKSLAFAERLKQHLQLPVHMWDERLTTMAANRTLLEADVSRKKRKQVVDKLAAVFILQGYLDNRSKG
ncbi:MAG: Holliday junction helicase [Paenibacillaceae bacterium]|nr:Holliday junction helicase [Paenibacillaceae bacterium]